MVKQSDKGAVRAAPSNLPAFRRSAWFAWIIRALFLFGAVGLGAWGIPQHPWYREYRLAHMTLAELQKERGDRLDDALLLYYAGMRLNQQERYTDADPLLRHAVGLAPDSPRYRDEWTRALLGSGLTTAAFGQLREFAGTHPQLASAHLLLGKFYVTQHSMLRASEELEKSISLDSSSGESWAYLVQAEDGLGSGQKALDAALHAVALRPNNAWDHVVYANLLERGNRPLEARIEYQKAVRLAPRVAAAHRDYARWLLAYGSASDAGQLESEARSAVMLDDRDAIAQLTLGRVFQRGSRWKDSLAPLEHAAALDSDDVSSPLALTESCLQLGQHAEAERWRTVYLQRQKYITQRRTLWEAIRVQPRDISLHKRLARLLGLHGDAAGCIHHYATALHNALDSPPVLTAAANDLIEGGHADAALPLARRAASIGSASPTAHEALGNALLALGQADLAEPEYVQVANWRPERAADLKKRLEDFEAARQAHPSPAEQAYLQARQLQRQQIGPRTMTSEVEAMAQKAVTLEPQNTRYLRFLLEVQLARREDDPAITTGNRLLTLLPRDASVHALLAVLLVEKANGPAEFSEVEEHLKSAARDPASAATWHYGMGLLALRRQQGEFAVNELKQAVQLDPQSDISYYKLGLAYKMAGNTGEAQKNLAIYRQRQNLKRQQANVLGDIATHPDQPTAYHKAAALFEAQGLLQQAKAIRVEARRRFGSD